MLLLAWALSGEAADAVDQSAVKAAFVYNFAAFTTWPDPLEQRRNLTICFDSRVDPALQRALALLAGKPVRTRTVRVISFGAVIDAADCDVLVLGVDGLSADPVMRAAITGKNVLTICDCSGGGRSGDVIHLIDDGRRLGFKVDAQAARAARLVISSKLLRLSRKAP